MSSFGLSHSLFLICNLAHKCLLEGACGTCLNTRVPSNLIGIRRRLLAMSKGRQHQSKDGNGN